MTIADVPSARLATMLIGLALLVGQESRSAAPAEMAVVERIVIHGNTRTRDKTIRRELAIVETQPVDTLELDRATRRLRALGFFLVAVVSARPGSMPERVTIEVDVVEVPRAGISTENLIATCTISQQ